VIPPDRKTCGVVALLLAGTAAPACLGDVSEPADSGLAGAGGSLGGHAEGTGGVVTETGGTNAGGGAAPGAGGMGGLGGSGSGGEPGPANEFITVFQTDEPSFEIQLPVLRDGSDSTVTVDWGDGTTTEVTSTTEPLYHVYDEPGSYVVTTSGAFTWSSFDEYCA